MSQLSNEFFGTERFRIRRRLGSGGMGVVYEAHDLETDKVVALKTLNRAEASHISRFKNEFRSLADVAHPNLVSLYEFMADGQYWFFTMELVQGINFLEYVRPGYTAKQTQFSKTPTLRKTSEGAETEMLADYEAETRELDSIRTVSFPAVVSSDVSLETSLSRSKLDLNRLRAALRQLAEGLHGLHETGKLHRDIKPSNVLVTEEGRVVILDFGLVAEVQGQVHDSVTLAGTPDYMSPEQGAQLPISRASDWYSVGVMLYQALAARLPFSGKFFEVMMNKQNFDPPAPVELIKNVPGDLNDLCVRLLKRNPDERPVGREILRLLGHGKTGPLRQPIMSSPAPALVQTAPFIGRERQLRELRDAFAVIRRGETVTVYLHGGSGMGKTALARHFLDELRTNQPEVVILEGRCYERESVPYKALDGVVDSLTKYLLSLPDAKAEALMPREVLALARLFPVMLQVDSVFNAPQREQEIPDPVTLRRKAFGALRELLGRISDRQPLVLYIDDLQWSDADSTTLLEDLLRPPDSPPLLLLSSFRTEDLQTKPFLKSLLEKTGTDSCREVLVGALSKNESYAVVRDLLGEGAASIEPFIEAILREARGSELVDLKRGLADALVNAGRPAEAAQAYLDLAEHTSAARSLDFKRRAAEQLLMGGHIKEGLEVIRSVLASVGITLPAGPRRALLSLMVNKLRVRLRGLKFTERQASEIPEADLFRIDICWAVAAGLGAVDLIRGADFQCRHLLLALRAGEPFRVARAMAFEAAQTASLGEPTRKRAVQIAQRAEELAQRVGHPDAIGLAMWASGVAAYLVGHWKNAATLCERAADILRDQCTGVTWQLTIANRFMLSALLYRGEIGEVARRVPVLLAAALEQGNLFAAMDLRTRLNLIWLAADDPDRARAEVIEALKDWPHEGFHLQHYTSMLALAQIELYTGDVEVAWKHVNGQWKALEDSMLMRIQVLRIEAMHLQARVALASGALSNDRSRRLRKAEKLAHSIAQERATWGTPFVSLILAGVAHQRGDQTKAVGLLSQAIELFDLAHMDLYEAVARRRLGELLNDERGHRHIAEADAWMQKRQVQNPPAMARMMAPGFD
jgi:serine/threonine protein kinase/tetratricopeptide (TPR) repeat protein